MARIRTVKPELPSDRKLASVSREARYTFVLLWTIADDSGLLRGESRQLLGDLYPFDKDVSEALLETWLSELTGIGVIRYLATTDGARIICVTNWSKHQRIDRPSPSFLSTILARDSREARETPAPGVLSLESRVLSPEEEAFGVGYRELGSPAKDNISLRGYLKASRNPGATAAVVRSFGPGGTDGRYSWEQVDRALTEMAAASVGFTSRALGGFLRKLHESPNGHEEPHQVFRRMAADARAELAKEAK